MLKIWFLIGIFDAVSTNWLKQMIWEKRVDFRDKICPFSMTTTHFSGFYSSWKVAPPTFVNTGILILPSEEIIFLLLNHLPSTKLSAYYEIWWLTCIMKANSIFNDILDTSISWPLVWWRKPEYSEKITDLSQLTNFIT